MQVLRIKKLEQEYITSPQVGDIYEYRKETGGYSILKIDSISKDSIYVLRNSKETYKYTKIHRIEKLINYSKESHGIAKSRLVELYNCDTIFDIDREE